MCNFQSSKRWRSQHLGICFGLTLDLGWYVSEFVLLWVFSREYLVYSDFCSIWSCCGCFVTKFNVSIVLTLLSCSCGHFVNNLRIDQRLKVISMCLPSLFSFSAPLIDWPKSDLKLLTTVWIKSIQKCLELREKHGDLSLHLS